jgi:glycosyltransferase involved in cell wall biosynthesis
MKVSVRIITYNHAPFIRQAIDSVLMQKTNFDFEIVIGEDGSKDGTREITQEYAGRHPDKIKLLLNDRKNVIHIHGKPTGRWNFINTLKNCRGEYVALLDGDDYWTSPDKLQKQVDLLDKNPQCAICFHNIEVINSDGSHGADEMARGRQPFYTLTDLLDGKFFPATGSVMFRNRLFGEMPEWIKTVMLGDYSLHVLNGQHGQFCYLDEVLGVYRRHAGGIWSAGGTPKDWPVKLSIERFKGLLHCLEVFKQNLGHQYHDVLRQKIAGLNYDLVWCYSQTQDWGAMRHHLIRALKSGGKHPRISLPFILKSYAIAFCPLIYRFFKTLKTRSSGLPMPSLPESKSTLAAQDK